MQRRFSLDDDFMNYKTNDIVYGYMRMISTSKPNPDKNANSKRIEYLTFIDYNKNKKDIAKLCGKKQARTIDTAIKKMIEAGLVEEGTIDIFGRQYGCYFFPFDYDGIYKLVDIELLKYLVHTASNNVIRVYLYLLNKYGMKKDYIFTQREIATAIGYAESTNTDMIKDILYCLNKQGIIQYEEVYDTVYDTETGKSIPTKRMKLKFVAEKRSDF